MYYHNIWDPLLIVSQMATLQFSFYLLLGLYLLLLHLLLSTPLHLALMLDGDSISLSVLSGWTVISALLLTAPSCALLMLAVVGRAKKCLDFTCSLFFLHYLSCTAYSGIPSSWHFYLVVAIALTLTVVISEYLCMREEMKCRTDRAAPSSPQQRPAAAAQPSAAHSLPPPAAAAAVRVSVDQLRCCDHRLRLPAPLTASCLCLGAGSPLSRAAEAVSQAALRAMAAASSAESAG